MRNPLVAFSKGLYSMDLNTLMFIANQARLPAAHGPKQAPNLPSGQCYNCLGDYLINDCPYPRQSQPNLQITCLHWLDTTWIVASNTWHLIVCAKPRQERKSNFEPARDNTIV